MSFLLDTDICSAYLRNNRRIVAKIMLHFGGFHVSVVTAAELLAWALRSKAPTSRIQGVRSLLAASNVELIDLDVAEKFGELRASMLDLGLSVGGFDLLNAAVALSKNLTMVTHNIRDYADVPGLTLDDWMTA